MNIQTMSNYTCHDMASISVSRGENSNAKLALLFSPRDSEILVIR